MRKNQVDGLYDAVFDAYKTKGAALTYEEATVAIDAMKLAKALAIA